MGENDAFVQSLQLTFALFQEYLNAAFLFFQEVQSLGRKVLFILPGTQVLDKVVEFMLHGLQSPFLLDKPYFLLLQCRFLLCNNGLQTNLFIRLAVGLFIQLAIGKIKAFQGRLGQLDAQLPVFLLDLIIFLRLLGLIFQAFQLVVDLE